MKHEDIVRQMSLEQKAKFVCGSDFWHLQDDGELGLPKLMITDGPHGLRKQNPNGKNKGLENSFPATCFPPAATSGCSWDEELLEREGEALGEECIKQQVAVLLGPGVNIKRAPTCGRNFEYFSEDPYLAGKCAAGLVRGIQKTGAGACLKHFACNSQEAFRLIVNEVADERALREIYFPAFEIAVKEAQPRMIMNSYNRINGTYSSQNDWLQNQVCRGEWGFQGLFVTDWGASVDRIPGLKAGTDLEMPSSGTLNTEKIIAAVRSGELSEEVLDERVDAVVDLILKSEPALKQNRFFDVGEHHEIAREVAEGSMQLLKNEDGVLPLKKGQKIAVIGEMAKRPRYQGAGSSLVNPFLLDGAVDGLRTFGADVTYSRGYRKSEDRVDEALFLAAENAAKEADVAVVFIGLTDGFEAEGYDRESIDLPSSHNALVSRVAKANPNTVVVLAGGSVVLMPWLSEVKGLLNSGLGGQAGGAAVANLLTGKVNPSGKTTETYPLSFQDNPTYGNYPGGPATSEHRESVYIGYRYYDKAKKEVLFPFGFGLSYTSFAYSGLKLSAKEIGEDETLTVTFRVKNTGERDGAEVAQLYVRDKKSTIFRPERELKGFRKVFLKAGETKTVSLELSKRAFAFWNVKSGAWQVETGDFTIEVGASSRDIRLRAALKVVSDCKDEIPDYRKSAPAYYDDVTAIDRRQFAAVFGEALPAQERDPNEKLDLYCCLYDSRHTKHGRAVCRLVQSAVGMAGGGMMGAMASAMALQLPIRNFVAMSMGMFTPEMAEGLLRFLNGGKGSWQGILAIVKGLPNVFRHLPDLLKNM